MTTATGCRATASGRSIRFRLPALQSAERALPAGASFIVCSGSGSPRRSSPRRRSSWCSPTRSSSPSSALGPAHPARRRGVRPVGRRDARLLARHRQLVRGGDRPERRARRASLALVACARRRVPLRTGHRQVPRQLVHRHARHEPGAGRGDAVHLGEQADRRRVPGRRSSTSAGATARHPDRRLLPRRPRRCALVRARVHAARPAPVRHRRQPRGGPAVRRAHRPDGLGLARRLGRRRRPRRHHLRRQDRLVLQHASARRCCSPPSPPCSSARRSSRPGPTSGARSSPSTPSPSASRACSSPSEGGCTGSPRCSTASPCVVAVAFAARAGHISVAASLGPSSTPPPSPPPRSTPTARRTPPRTDDVQPPR